MPEVTPEELQVRFAVGGAGRGSGFGPPREQGPGTTGSRWLLSRILMPCNNFRPDARAPAWLPHRPDSLRSIAGRYNSPARARRSQRFLRTVRISAESEAHLVAKAQQGDRNAFGALVEIHAPMVRRMTRAVLRHAADADDAAQEAFLSAWNALDRFQPSQALGPWLARIAVNAARDLARRRRVRTTEPVPFDRADAGPLPDQVADRQVMGERLDAALATLPERQRVVLVLFEVEGYVHSEIGQLLGVPEGTVRSELFHAKRKLRESLRPLKEG